MNFETVIGEEFLQPNYRLTHKLINNWKFETPIYIKGDIYLITSSRINNYDPSCIPGHKNLSLGPIKMASGIIVVLQNIDTVR